MNGKYQSTNSNHHTNNESHQQLNQNHHDNSSPRRISLSQVQCYCEYCNGRVDVERMVGKGGFSTVFLESKGESVLKILPIDQDFDQLQTGLEEAKALISLSHPNIVNYKLVLLKIISLSLFIFSSNRDLFIHHITPEKEEKEDEELEGSDIEERRKINPFHPPSCPLFVCILMEFCEEGAVSDVLDYCSSVLSFPFTNQLNKQIEEEEKDSENMSKNDKTPSIQQQQSEFHESNILLPFHYSLAIIYQIASAILHLHSSYLIHSGFLSFQFLKFILSCQSMFFFFYKISSWIMCL